MAAKHASGPHCAVYTRKSSEEGLEQEFNSLDAQREAGEAYIKSQAGEGWRLVRTRYDDGGISGGTMQRPALKQLLADIEARRVDTARRSRSSRRRRSPMTWRKTKTSKRAGPRGFADKVLAGWRLRRSAGERLGGKDQIATWSGHSDASRRPRRP